MALRNIRTAIVTAVLILVAGAVATTQVFAHSRPLRFDPAPGAVLQAAPGSVTGYFNSDIRRDPNWSFLQVTGAQGERVDTGETVLSNDRLQMAASLKPNLPAGAYMVSWRTWDDADGEIFGDCYVFYVGQAAADAGVTSKQRLDGGSKCPRLEVSAKNGTPTPNQLSAALTPTAEESNTQTSSDSDSGTGKLIIGLVIGVIGGTALGLLGGRLVGRRA